MNEAPKSPYRLGCEDGLAAYQELMKQRLITEIEVSEACYSELRAALIFELRASLIFTRPLDECAQADRRTITIGDVRVAPRMVRPEPGEPGVKRSG
jgi:histone H3/H4